MNYLRTKIAQRRWPNWALLTIEHILYKTHYENIISDFDEVKVRRDFVK